MGRINISIDGVLGNASGMQTQAYTIGGIRSNISGISGSIDGKIKARYNIAVRLSNVVSQINDAESRLHKIIACMKESAISYDVTELRIINEANSIYGVHTAGKPSGNSASFNNDVFFTAAKEDLQPIPEEKNSNANPNIGVAGWASKTAINSTSKSTSAGETAVKYLKKMGKAGLDALGKFNSYGKEVGLPIALLKNIIDGDGITGKDIGSTLKGMGNSIIGMCETYSKEADEWPLSTANVRELAGLTPYKTISMASTKAGWLARLENAGTSAWETFKKEILPNVKMTTENGTEVVDTVKKGTKVAGWVLSLVANGFSNYDEYNKGGMSSGRAWAETVTETLVDIGKGAAIAAGVAAGCAAIGVAAPAVVVGGIGVAVSFVADVVCEKLTGKNVTEFVSDTVLDAAASAGKAITGAAKNVGKAVSGWFKKLTSGGDKSAQYAGA